MRRTATDRKYEAVRARQITDKVTRINPIPTIALEVCDYDKKRKVLKLASEYIGMPLTFYVKSHHTGKEIRFVPVNPADVLYDQDQWDGEQQIYRPVGVVPGVDHMVIFNQW